MEIYIESMTRFVHKIAPWKNIHVRCWRQENGYEIGVEKQTEEDVKAVLDKFRDPNVGKLDLAKNILAIDRMNAVEVIDETGAGVVVYKDWP